MFWFGLYCQTFFGLVQIEEKEVGCLPGGNRKRLCLADGNGITCLKLDIVHRQAAFDQLQPRMAASADVVFQHIAFL
jgi:hypothetical protein